MWCCHPGSWVLWESSWVSRGAAPSQPQLPLQVPCVGSLRGFPPCLSPRPDFSVMDSDVTREPRKAFPPHAALIVVIHLSTAGSTAVH